jgi:hypothetical protein
VLVPSSGKEGIREFSLCWAPRWKYCVFLCINMLERFQINSEFPVTIKLEKLSKNIVFIDFFKNKFLICFYSPSIQQFSQLPMTMLQPS